MPRNAHVPPAPRTQIAASLQREMKSNMTAEAFAEQHGPALLQWLQTNTVECACTTLFGPDENLQRGTAAPSTSRRRSPALFAPHQKLPTPPTTHPWVNWS